MTQSCVCALLIAIIGTGLGYAQSLSGGQTPTGRPFAIAVMTTFASDGLEAEQCIARIAREAWSYFDRMGKSSPLGRIVR